MKTRKKQTVALSLARARLSYLSSIFLMSEEDRIHLINAYASDLPFVPRRSLFFTESLTIVLFTKTW